MLTRLQQRDNKTEGVLINAMCPGWVKTDMSSQQGTKSAAEVIPCLAAPLSAPVSSGRNHGRSPGASSGWFAGRTILGGLQDLC